MIGHTIKPRREDVLAQRAAHVGRATGIACDAVCAKADGDLVKAARLFREAASKSKRGDVKARYLASAKACREELGDG